MTNAELRKCLEASSDFHVALDNDSLELWEANWGGDCHYVVIPWEGTPLFFCGNELGSWDYSEAQLLKDIADWRKKHESAES